MKKLIILIQLLWIGVLTLNGQASSMMTDSVLYITLEDEVHLRDKKAKYLVKLGTDLGFEFKISKALSLNAELFPDFLTHDVNQSLGIGYGVGARYYYQMKSRIKAGKQANNLSGKYVSLMLGQGYNFFRSADTLLIDGSFGFSAGVGVQQRYLEHEYFDYRLNLDYTSVNRGNDNMPGFVTYTLRTKSAYGYVIGKRHTVDKEALCPVIKCYTNRKSGFKINRNNIFSLSRSTSSERPEIMWGLSLRPRIGHELKIMNSAFSVAQDFSLLLSFQNFERTFFDKNFAFNPTDFKLNYTSFRYGVALRYYYSMNRRVLAGKQGNNLSGFYCYSEFQHERRAIDFTSKDKTNRGSVVLGFGRQTEITGRLYMDGQVGLGHSVYSDRLKLGIAIDIDFTVGYMF